MRLEHSSTICNCLYSIKQYIAADIISQKAVSMDVQRQDLYPCVALLSWLFDSTMSTYGTKINIIIIQIPTCCTIKTYFERYVPVCLAYKPYFFSQRTIFFSHNKSASQRYFQPWLISEQGNQKRNGNIKYMWFSSG